MQFEIIREELKRLYELPEGAGIFFSPSGTDTEYITLMIGKILNPGKKITNVLTCNDEVGSGCKNAAYGRFFMNLEPHPGYHEHLGPNKKGKPLLELGDDVDCIDVKARQPDGEV